MPRFAERLDAALAVRLAPLIRSAAMALGNFRLARLLVVLGTLFGLPACLFGSAPLRLLSLATVLVAGAFMVAWIRQFEHLMIPSDGLSRLSFGAVVVFDRLRLCRMLLIASALVGLVLGSLGGGFGLPGWLTLGDAPLASRWLFDAGQLLWALGCFAATELCSRRQLHRKGPAGPPTFGSRAA